MLEPLSPDRFTRELAAHLLNRAGFGAAPAEVDRFFEMGLRKAVDTLVQYEAIPRNRRRPCLERPRSRRDRPAQGL